MRSQIKENPMQRSSSKPFLLPWREILVSFPEMPQKPHARFIFLRRTFISSCSGAAEQSCFSYSPSCCELTCVFDMCIKVSQIKIFCGQGSSSRWVNNFPCSADVNEPALLFKRKMNANCRARMYVRGYIFYALNLKIKKNLIGSSSTATRLKLVAKYWTHGFFL